MPPSPSPVGLLNCVFILLPHGSHLNWQIEVPAVLERCHHQNMLALDYRMLLLFKDYILGALGWLG